MRAWLLLSACLLSIACDNPSDPSEDPSPGTGTPISGNESIGWDQPAPSAADLAAFRYLLYVDNVPVELTGVTCDPSPRPAGYACRAPLPQLAPGAHRLELATFVENGGRHESGRSAALSVVVSGLTAPGPGGRTLTTSEGATLGVGVITAGLVEPTDLAFLPGGGILIAERGGRIRPVVGDQVGPPFVVPGVDVGGERGLLAVTPDTEFAKTSWVYAVYTTESALELSRFRLTPRGLVDRVVLMNHLEPIRPAPAASLRFGPDGKLYVAFDDGGDPERAGDLGSFAGKLLRMNADATTPTDQAAGTPVYALNVNAPRGLDWDRARPLLWVLERDADGEDRLQALSEQPNSGRRGVPVARYTLPAGTDASGMAVYSADLIPGLKGSLLVAGRASGSILRFKLAADEPATILSTERWVADELGRVRAIGVGPDGAIYLCNDNSLIRVSSVGDR
jgi:quinoprotein glucose dehydrogenase